MFHLKSWFQSPPSVFFFTTHKAASTFLRRLSADLAAAAGLKLISPVLKDPSTEKVEFWKARGVCYSPLRLPFESVSSNLLAQSKVILHLRDPRDVLVSLFFSHAYSHRTKENGFNPTAEQREHWIGQGIDQFILSPQESGLSKAQIFAQRYDLYLKKVLAQPHVTFVKYEEMISDFPSWLTKVATGFPIKNTARVVEPLVYKYRDEFSVSGEDIYAHKRQVRAGNYKEKLQPNTIQHLNRIFHKTLQTLSYQL